ncbi:MAG: hypothetical protein ACOH2Q_17155 [Rhodococcus sp. (in: high G+C Gram-positive bacteria)]
MAESPNSDALVIRFKPMQPEAVLRRAALDARRIDGPGEHTASVWCAVRADDESEEQARRRVLQVTADNGLNADKNKKFWVCTYVRELRDRGFVFIKDGYEGEPEAHFSVILGNPPTLDDVERFIEPFHGMER